MNFFLWSFSSSSFIHNDIVKMHSSLNVVQIFPEMYVSMYRMCAPVKKIKFNNIYIL